MKRAKWSILLLCLFGSTVCFADTVVITFKSGKTQEVTLEDRSEAVEGIQFRSGQRDAVKTAQPQQAGDSSQKADQAEKNEKMRDATTPKDKNQGMRFKWAEPKTGE